jgi:hypothetical protein
MKAPAHVYFAARLLDRFGVDEAVVGDLLEVYEARPSAVRLWREVAAALVARAAGHVRDNKPQTIRRVGTAVAAVAVIALAIPGSSHVDLASSVRIEDMSGGWFVTTSGNGKTRLLPTVSFQLRNVSPAPLALVQVNVLFRRMGEHDAWSDVMRKAISSHAIASGPLTEPIVVKSPVGYTGDEATSSLMNHSKFVDTAVAIYGRHGSEDWTYLGEYPLPRRIVGSEMGPAPVRPRATSLHIP